MAVDTGYRSAAPRAALGSTSAAACCRLATLHTLLFVRMGGARHAPACVHPAGGRPLAATLPSTSALIACLLARSQNNLLAILDLQSSCMQLEVLCCSGSSNQNAAGLLAPCSPSTLTPSRLALRRRWRLWQCQQRQGAAGLVRLDGSSVKWCRLPFLKLQTGCNLDAFRLTGQVSRENGAGRTERCTKHHGMLSKGGLGLRILTAST